MEEGAELSTEKTMHRGRELMMQNACEMVWIMHGMTSLFIDSVHCRGQPAIMSVIIARLYVETVVLV